MVLKTRNRVIPPGVGYKKDRPIEEILPVKPIPVGPISLANSLKSLYPDMFPDTDLSYEELATKGVANIKRALKLDESLNAIKTVAYEDPDTFIADLQSKGRNQDTTNLLTALQVPDDVVNKIFPTAGVTPPKLNWRDKINEIKENPAELLPFAGELAQASRFSLLYQTAKMIKDGKTPSPEALQELIDFAENASNERDIGYKILDTVSQLPQFGLEILATIGTGGTAGVGAVGVKGAALTARQLLKSYISKAGLQSLKKLAIQGTIQSAKIGIARVPPATIEKQLMTTLSGNEEPLALSVVKSMGENWVEVVSEKTGGLFGSLTNAAKGALIKKGLFSALIKANPNISPGIMKRAIDKMQWHGVAGEWSEERIGDLMHGALAAVGLGNQPLTVPTLEQTIVELVSFSVPGGAMAIAGGIPGAITTARLEPQRGSMRLGGEEVKPTVPTPAGVKEGVTNAPEVTKVERGIPTAPPGITQEQQNEYTKRMTSYLDKADVEIKRVNDDFMAGKTSLAENQTQRDSINAELDKQANKIRAEMGFPEAIIPPPVTKEVTPAPVVKETLPNRVRQIHSELEADVNIARKKIAEIKTPLPTQGADIQFARLALNDANKLIKQAETLTNRIERGQAVSEEEVNALNDKIQSLKDYYKFEAKTTEQVKAKLVEYIKSQLPLPRQGELLAKVKNVKTPEQLTEAIARVQELAEAQSEKTLRADIIRELKKTAPRIEKGITVGRLSIEVQPTIDKLRASLLVGIKGVGGVARNVEAYEAARAKIEQGIADYRDGKITWDALLEANEELKYTGMYGMSSVQLQEALDYIQEMKRLGKDLRKIKREEIKAQRKEVVDKAVVEVTGGEGIKSGVGTLRNKDIAGTKKVLDQPVNSQYGFVNLLDKLGKFAKGTKMYQGFLMRFANLTQRATNTENAGREASFKIVRDKFREIYNVKKTREATRLLTTLTTEDVDLGTFKITTKEGVKYLPLKLTRAEMMEAYQLYKNPKNLETFKEGMHWTPEIMTKIVNTLTEQDIKWADWLQNEFYDTYYDKINPFYRDEFNIDMPKNPDYVPQSRDFEAGELDEVQLLFQDQKRYASVTNKSLKAREANIRPFQFKGVFTVLTNHIVQMEHFMAWAETMHEMRSMFGNSEVRTAIRQYHSNDILKRIDDYMNDFARGGVDRVQFLNTLDKLRSNFAVSVLALKPSIGLQQIWTVGAFMTEMKGKDFVTGVAHFWRHPIENYKWMMENSTYIKNRYTGGNYERDIRLAQQQGVAKTMSGAGNMSQYLLWQVTQGDKFGVMPGWWAKYQAGLKAKLSPADAMTAADLASERTQNTSELASLSWLQRGSSWGKLLTMFQSQPNKYFRIVADNIRNMQYGRQSKVKGITNLLLVWVVLPALFQWVADAFKFEKEKQARILVLGPLNNILVAGQLIQTAWGWFTEDSFDWQASPVLSTVRDFQNFSSKLIKIMNQMKDPYEDVVMDDIVAALEFFSKGIGQLTGAPTPYLIMVERAIRDGDPRELVFSRWALEEPTPTLQVKTNRISNTLGTVDEDVTDLPVDKKPPVKDTTKVFSEVKEALSKTLLSDVTEKRGFNPKVIAIAQAIMAQDTLETYPNKRLFEIIDDILSDNTLNYTFSQYYMDYQDRQKITSLAKLKEWDGEHPSYNLGNVTPEQYKLMRQYELLETKVEKAQFRKDHPEINANPRTEWLKANPKENAQLAVWGQAKILTKEAYNQFRGLVKSLDIPDSALPELSMPPEGSVDNYFKYQDMVTDNQNSSWEAQLMMAKDTALRDFLGLKPTDTPIASLELKVKNRDKFDKLEGFSDKDSVDYVADEKAMAEAVKKFKAANPEFVDDTRRIEAIEKGTDQIPTTEDIISQHVDYGKLNDKEGVGSSSAEVMLYRVDNPEYDKWRQDTAIWGDQALKPVDQSRIPIWRIDVEMDKLDEGSSEYMVLKRQKEAHTEGFGNFVDDYVTYYDELPVSGYRRDRMLYDDEGNLTPFGQSMRDIKGITIKPFNEIPDARYDELLEKEDRTPEEDWEMEGYKLFIGKEEYVPEYVGYKTITDKGNISDEDMWFEDDWYLQDHPEFYKAMLQLYINTKGKEGWQPKKDKDYWSKIPPRDIFEMWLVYDSIIGTDKMSATEARKEFRMKNPRLDAWGVLRLGWTPVVGKGVTTKGEQQAAEYSEKRKEIDRLREEIDRKLRAMKL